MPTSPHVVDSAAAANTDRPRPNAADAAVRGKRASMLRGDVRVRKGDARRRRVDNPRALPEARCSSSERAPVTARVVGGSEGLGTPTQQRSGQSRSMLRTTRQRAAGDDGAAPDAGRIAAVSSTYPRQIARRRRRVVDRRRNQTRILTPEEGGEE